MLTLKLNLCLRSTGLLLFPFFLFSCGSVIDARSSVDDRSNKDSGSAVHAGSAVDAGSSVHAGSAVGTARSSVDAKFGKTCSRVDISLIQPHNLEMFSSGSLKVLQLF